MNDLIYVNSSDSDEIKLFFEHYGRRQARETVNALQQSGEKGPQVVDALMRLVHHSKKALAATMLTEGIEQSFF
jgi:hypothetical protein